MGWIFLQQSLAKWHTCATWICNHICT